MKYIYKENILVYAFIFVFMFSAQLGLYAENKKKVKDESKKESTSETLTPYDKLFDKKKDVKTSKGILTLHQVDGKLYIEAPINQMEKSFLMTSVVESVSNFGLSYAGQRLSRPLHLSFSKTDSLAHIRAVYPPQLMEGTDVGIFRAIEESSVPPIIHSAPILAHSPDSSAIVFDATTFFVSDSKYIGKLNFSSLGGFVQKVSTFKKEISALKDVKAFENNVSVISDMSYSFKTSFLGMESGGEEYLTVELKTSLERLPNELLKPRIADYRIGTDVTAFSKLSEYKQGEETEYYASRWRIEPKNEKDYFAGIVVEPVKPIVFYVDTLFVPTWREAVKRGLLKWNLAFIKAGFKDVIQVFDYPTAEEDSLFDASSGAYNCVRYAQLPSRTITNLVSKDPRTGEILGASILFFRDAPVTLQRERIYQTAEIEPEVRSYELPDDLMCEALEMAAAKEMGYCLGLTDNFAASSWMPVDSLRSATFTAREGITSSIMDQIRYNYVARPGDKEKGVEIAARNLGVYDYYVIDWLYRQYPDNVDERKVLNGIIEEKAADRRFLYGKRQIWSSWFDPRSMLEDLGDDKIAAAKNGIETLKYISKNAPAWINKDEVDESYRELFVDFIFLKLYDYYRSVVVNIGGIEINPRYEGDRLPSYVPVNRELQKESLKFILEQSENLSWIDNTELIRMSGMVGEISSYFANNLVSLPFQRIPVLAFAQHKMPVDGTDENYKPYTVDEMIGDIMDFALKNIRNGDAPSEAQKGALYSVTQLLLKNSDLPNMTKETKNSTTAFQLVEENNPYSYSNVLARCRPDELHLDYSNDNINSLMSSALTTSSFEVLTNIKFLTHQDESYVFYKHLLDLQKELRRSRKKFKNERVRSDIDYLLRSIYLGIGKETKVR